MGDNRLETWMNIFEDYKKSMSLSVLEQKDIFRLFEELKKLREEIKILKNKGKTGLTYYEIKKVKREINYGK